MKINVTAIIGSLRKNSINRSLYTTYKEITKDIMSVEEIELQQFPLYNPDIESTPEYIIASAHKIQKSDGLLFFSPEYNYSVTGVLKNAIDWLSKQSSQPLSDKPAAILGASPGIVGTARMQYHLRQIGVCVNLNFLNKPEVMVGNAHSKIKEGKVIDLDTIEFLKLHAKEFCNHILK